MTTPCIPLVTIADLESRGAIVAIQDGNHGEKHPKVSDYVDSGIPFIMANDISDGTLDVETCHFISETTARDLRIGFALPGDVLITHKGTLGNIALVDRADPFLMLTPQVTYYRCDNQRLLNSYLAYAFREPAFLARMKSCADQGTRPYVSIRAQRRLSIACPQPAVQSAIVEKLQPYDALLATNRRRIATLENAARLLYEEWFVRFRFPGHEHTRITKHTPDGWQVKQLRALCPDFREAADPTELDPDTPYIGLEHIPRRSMTLCEWGTAEEVTSTKLRYRQGDILFGKIRPYFHKVGATLSSGVTSSDAIVLRPVEPDLRALCLLTLSSDWFVAVVSKTAKEGSKMPRADWNLMEQHPIAVPPRPLLSAFNAVVDPIVDQLRVLALANRQLRAARDLLLPRLMSGELAA